MPKRTSKVVEARRGEARRAAFRRRLAISLFSVAALAVLGVAAWLVITPVRAVLAPSRQPADTAPSGEERQVMVTMAGFDPQVLRVGAGQPFTLRFVNPDSQFHADGGGWHQFRVEALGVDVRIPPKSERRQTFAGLSPGSYAFYCDVCCGGKENPTMRGVIEVAG